MKAKHRFARISAQKARLVADAIRRYVEEEGWQVAAIEEGVRQADADDFATEEEVKAAFSEWGVDVR